MHQNGQSLHVAPLLAAALDSTPFGLLVLEADQRVRLLTRGAAGLLGLPAAFEHESVPFADLLFSCTRLGAASRQALCAALHQADREPGDLPLHEHGATGAFILSADIRPAGVLGWVMSLKDVTRSRRGGLPENESSDPLTGLCNRQRFMLILQDRLAAWRSVPTSAAPCVLLVGLQRLKQVNDTLGLGTGDATLRLIGERLAGLLSDDEVAARLGGDEFAVATSNTGTEGLTQLAGRISACLSMPCPVDGSQVSLGVHVGLACAPQGGQTADALVANARLALQETTSRGTAPIRFFEPSLTERVRLRRLLEAELRVALGQGEFELHYQPQVDVDRGCVTGLEALIRWRNPRLGLVSPVKFVPLAEQIGLINEIGDWVLGEACRQAARWPDEVTVAVNASPLQFETGQFARSVAKALAETGLAAGRLEIEITESLLLRQTGDVLQTLAALHALGVRLVLDDFGTGYASLSQLSRFRFDKIKIDGSFVSASDAVTQNSAIVRAIATLGQSLGIPTIAEGVETQAQLEQMQADGCSCVQGFVFSKPVPPAEVDRLLDRLRRPAAGNLE